MRRRLTSASKRLHLLKKKNEESRGFLEKLAVQAEGEFDMFFIRARTEVQIKETQIKKDFEYRYEAEEQLLRRSLANISSVTVNLEDMRNQTGKLLRVIGTSGLIRRAQQQRT